MALARRSREGVGRAGWLPARVPGCVLDDLVRAGEVPSPYYERDSRLSERVAQRAWVYRRRFVAAQGNERIRFDVVDHSCTVFVDGEKRARHESTYRPLEVDVSDFIDGDEHLLAVVVDLAPGSEPQVGDTARVRVHKSRMGYVWDFRPRIVNQGIWRSVTRVEGWNARA